MGDDVRQDETGLQPDGLARRATDNADDTEGHLARSKVVDEVGPDGMKKAKGFDEDTEGHVRLRASDEFEPDRLKLRGYGEDTEGHGLRARADDRPEMEPEGLSNHPRAAGDEEDAEGHLRR